jgi:hypothetical protein
VAIVSRPIVYSALAILTVAVYVWSNGGPDKAAKPAVHKPATAKAAEPDWNFPPSETAVHFDKPEGKMRNVFAALVQLDKSTINPEESEIMKVPANLAQGDANWAYTGMVVVDGVKLALLENSSTHQGGYVKEGEIWKKSRIKQITTESIVVVGQDGSETTVIRFNANATPKPKPPPDAGFRPMDLPNLKGVIGSPQVEITPIEQTSKPGKSMPAISDNQ